MPREKALSFGISSLSNEELLALIIKSAYKDKDVFDLSADIIEAANGFENLLSLSYEELINIKGIKKAKALEILAILEIGKRLSNIKHIPKGELDAPGKVVEWLRFNLGFADEEHFFVIFLNGRCSIIRSQVMFKGNRFSSNVGIDEILRKAILLKASSIIVAHNHPSDDPRPSRSDRELTARLANACKLLGVELADHIIIGKSSYLSFKNHSMLE